MSQCLTRRAFPAEYNDPPGSTELSGIAQRDNENWWRYEDMQVDGYSQMFRDTATCEILCWIVSVRGS